MIFEILFFISLLGLIILFLMEKKNKRGHELLHSIINSCNIDSIRFERRMELLRDFLNKIFYGLLIYAIRIFHTSIRHGELFIGRIKMYIRRKLFGKQKVEKVSEYISEIKK